MRIAKLALAAAVSATMAGASAQAQQMTAGQSPFAIRPVAYDRYYPDEPASPSDAPAATPSCAAPECGEEGCGGSECVSCYSEKYDPVRLFGASRLEKRLRWETQGWIAQSYTQNFYSPRDRYNGPVTWTDRSNEWQLNELSIITGRNPNTGGSGWDWGFNSFTIFGTSAKFDTSNGFEDSINKGTSRNYSIAFPALNFQLAYNDLKVMVGRFVSPVGFYTVGTYLNFFNTIPYTYQWGEPFTHTGFLAQYQITDDLNLGAGMTRGWDNTGNFNPNAGYLGTLTRANLLKEGDSAALVQVWSNEPSAVFNTNQNYSPAVNGGNTGLYAGNNPTGSFTYNGFPNFTSRYFQTFVYSRPVNEKLTYILQSDFGTQNNAFGDGRAAQWYGINQYWYYKVNNCWSWGFNCEWFRDQNGFRVGGFLPNYGNATQGGTGSYLAGFPAAGGVARGGFNGNFYQMTFGPRWTPNPNLVIRPNMRWDWYDGPRGFNNLTPYGDGQRWQQGILGTDVIVVF